MPLLEEPLSGGLVQTRPEHKFESGELLLANNCNYRHDSLSLWGADGRLTKFSGIDGSGLAICKFDSGATYFVWQDIANAQLFAYETTNGLSGASVTSYTAGNTLATANYSNQHFAFNGANDNMVLYHTGSSSVAPAWSIHGLPAVTTAPGLTLTTGSWPLGMAGLNKYYEYWVTESYTFGGLTIESSCEATAVATSDIIDATTDAISVALPPVVSPYSTHFNIYRSAGKLLRSDKQFPYGLLIATVPINSSAQWLDGGSAATSYTFPASASSATWANPTNVLSDNAANATVTAAAGTTKDLTASNFSFSGVADAINGVTVAIEASKSDLAASSLICWISLDGGTTVSAGRTINCGTSITAVTIGGAQDLWGLTTPLASALSLFVYVRASSAIGSNSFAIDYIKAIIHHTASQSVGVVAFPTVVITIADQASAVPANGKPPKASTGDVVDGVLVTNDVANPRHVRWSLPSKPHAFPSIYLDDIGSGTGTKCIRGVNGRVAVGTIDKLYCYDYMPSEDDASFTTGRARRVVDPYFGIVGPNAACVFNGPEGRPVLAFVSLDGLRASDMTTSWPLCSDIDWRAILTPISVLDRVILVNNPRNYELILYYPGGDTNGVMTKKLTFNYSPLHIKQGGQLKACGPASTGVAAAEGVTGAASVAALDTGYSWSVYEMWRTYSGSPTDGDKLWRVVDRGTGSATTAAPSWRTRRIFAAGVGSEWNADLVFLHALMGATVALTPTVTGTKADAVSGNHAGSAVNFTTTSGLQTLAANLRMRAGAVDLAVAAANTNTSMRFDTLHIIGRGWGGEDA